jgi:serine protease Do
VVRVEVTAQAKPVTAENLNPLMRHLFDRDGDGIVYQAPPRQGLGSGFFISSDGYILTNYHVIENATEVHVKLMDGREFKAEIVGTDENTDVALLRVDETGLPSLKLGDSEAMRVGDWVVAMGNPHGLGHTVTQGIVSAKGRSIGAGPFDDFIQTDAAINPGNSGGPLFNLHGEVVGINTAIIASADGLAFAIPSNMVRDMLDQLKKNGRVARGWLGIRMQPLTVDLAAELGLKNPKGALVSEVMVDSPARKGGLKAGDVIVRVNDTPVDDPQDLARVVGLSAPGSKVKIGIIRNSKPQKISVTLSAFPEDGEVVASAPRPQQNKTAKVLGLELMNTQSGVRVNAVDIGSPAHGVLRRGDIVLEIERKRVTDVANAIRLIEDADASVLVAVERDGRRMYVTVRKR